MVCVVASQYPLYQTQPFALQEFTDGVTNLLCVWNVNSGSFKNAIQNKLRCNTARNTDSECHRGMPRWTSVLLERRGKRLLEGDQQICLI